MPKSVLFLVALGPTATVLAYDLSKIGYQAIDIGHIDISFVWVATYRDYNVNQNIYVDLSNIYLFVNNN